MKIEILFLLYSQLSVTQLVPDRRFVADVLLPPEVTELVLLRLISSRESGAFPYAVVEDPLVPNGYGSRPFDDEGTKTTTKVILGPGADNPLGLIAAAASRRLPTGTVHVQTIGKQAAVTLDCPVLLDVEVFTELHTAPVHWLHGSKASTFVRDGAR